MRCTMAGISEAEEVSSEIKPKSAGTDKTETDNNDLSFHTQNSMTNSMTWNGDSSTSQKTKAAVTVTIDSDVLSLKSRNPVTIALDPDILDMVSSVMSEAGDADEDSRIRKSHLFCFVCCDMVKACITMNAVYMTLLLIHVMISLMGAPLGIGINLYQALEEDGYMSAPIFVDDDDFFSVYDNNESPRLLDPWGIVGYVKTGLGFIFAIVGIVGAVKFEKFLVLTSAIWQCIYILLTLMELRFAPAILTVPFAYTNFHCFVSLHSGSITRENYASEKQCCCFVTDYYTDDYYDDTYYVKEKRCSCCICCNNDDDDDSEREDIEKIHRDHM